MEYHFLFSFVALFAYFWVFGPFTIKEMCLVFRKSACPFRQMKTKKSPFFKKSLARASGLVLMSVPGERDENSSNSRWAGIRAPGEHDLQKESVGQVLGVLRLPYFTWKMTEGNRCEL